MKTAAYRVLLMQLISVLMAAVGFAGTVPDSVGFQDVRVPAPGGAIPAAVWYPTDARATPQPVGLFTQTVAPDAPVRGKALRLIVISHGNGGTRDGHYDTALALAQAGFVVAALEHTGDNYRDQSRATDVLNRPRELRRLIDYMLTEWPSRAALNTTEVGAFGFSAGGFTVLAAAGGEPDLSLVGPHCAAHPEYFDCMLVKQHPAAVPTNQEVVHDARIRVLVVAAPALGFTFTRGLADVKQPIQLWRADDDRILPAPEYADAVRAALPKPPEFHAVPGAGHYDFLAPCSAALAKVAPPICTSEPGFDRAAFHLQFNQAMVAFFKAHL